MSIFSSLKRDQKEAIGLLQIGTFLEYFDLMLYVHMAVLLNELFFPKTDPHTAALLAAFAFCSTYVMRPFGALIFGYIGDHIGRKTTVILTTMMMSFSCIIMAALPTYAQIGITASWIITLCRVLQGLSSMGEIIGAEIYLTEIIKKPIRYPIVSLMAVFSILGSIFALGVGSLVTMNGFDWRIAFWIGAGVAMIGSTARTRLRETYDFVDMKRRIKRSIEEAEADGLGKAAHLLRSTNLICKEKINKKTALTYFAIQCGWPVCFYFSYIYCGNILKNNFHYTAEEVIHHNLLVSITQLIGFLILTFLCHKIFPLKLLKAKVFLFLPFIFSLPYFLSSYSTTPFFLFLIQSFCAIFGPMMHPAPAVFLIHFPIFKRFTAVSFIYALSRSLVYVVTSFGLVYLGTWLGTWGICFILLFTTIGFLWGVLHFEKLERNFETPSQKLSSKEPLMEGSSTIFVPS